MGTNYYAVKNGPSTHGGYHIGKSSIGWLFHFQRQNEKWQEPSVVWNTFQQLKDWLKENTVDKTDFVIMDEYDKIIPYDEFIDLVEWKQKDRDCKGNPDNFKNADNVDGYRFSSGDFW